MIFIASASFAQSTSPRFGTLKNQDNTGRVLTYKLISVTDAAGADTTIIKANAFTTLVKVASVDSVMFGQPVVTSCAYGDKLEIIATATTGTPKLKFTGDKWKSAGTATMSTGLRAVINFVFDGSKWVEYSRVVQ